MKIISILKSFDIYRRFDEEQRVQTPKGATITLIGWIIICMLLLSELYSYMTPGITGIILIIFLASHYYFTHIILINREYDC